jgi:hypothetical protein
MEGIGWPAVVKRITGGRGCGVVLLGVLCGLLPVPARADQFGAQNGGQYTFGSAQPALLATGDFNGDGVSDVAVGVQEPSPDGGAGQVQLLLGHAAESTPPKGLPTEIFTGFTKSASFPPSNFTAEPIAIVAGDFNGDGKLDLAVQTARGGGLAFLLGNGSGGLTESPGSPIFSASGEDMAAGKFTAGKPSEVAILSGSNVIVVGETTANHYGTVATTNLSAPLGRGNSVVTAGTFTNSGDVDLAMLDGTTGKVNVLAGNGHGGFHLASGSPVASGCPGCALTSIAAGKFNGDAHEDLALGTSNGHVAVLLGKGDAAGSFTPATGSPFLADGDGAAVEQMAVAPFGTSTVAGIAAADSATQGGGCKEPCVLPHSSVAVLIPNGSGGFTQAAGSPYHDGGDTSAIAPGDFNQDGRSDLVFDDESSCQGNGLGVLLNAGTTGVAPPGTGLPGDRCSVQAPTVTTGSATNVHLTSATLNGTLDQHYQAVTGCSFQYGIGAFTNTIPCSFPGKPGNLTVSAKIAGLKSLSKYQFRLIASTAGGTVVGDTLTLQTCDAGELTFGDVDAVGCFLKNKDGNTYRSTGDATVNGIGLSPAHGGITVNPGKKLITERGNGLLKIGGVLPLPWVGLLNWHLDGEVELGKSVNLPLGGFHVVGELKAQPVEGEMEITGSASMNVVGDPIEATVVMTTSNDEGIAAAEIGVGPADAEPLEPTTLQFCDPRDKTQPEGFKCVKEPTSDFKSYTFRLVPKGGVPDSNAHLLPICAMSDPAPVGYKCEEVTEANGKTKRAHLVPLDPGVVKLGGVIPVEALDFGLERHLNPDGSTGYTWSGSAEIALGDVFPGAGSDATLDLNATIETNPFRFDKAGFALEDGEIPIGPMTLTDASFELELHPDVMVSANAGVELGDGAVSYEGGFEFTRGENSGFTLNIDGKYAVKTIELRGHVDLDFADGDAKVQLGGSFTRSWGPVSATLGIGGGMEFEPQVHFQLTGDGSISAFGATVNAHGIVSDAGVGACGEVDVLVFSGQVGFKHFWNGGTDFNGCDFSGLYTVGEASASAAASDRVVTVPVGTRREEFAAVGASGPPAVTLTGPDGTTLSTPAVADHIQFAGGNLALGVSSSRTTYFVIEHPHAGRWRIAPEAGQPNPVRYELAKPMAPLGMRAIVSGRGHRRELLYKFRRQHGVSVQFFQTGGRLIATSNGGNGMGGFAVAPGKAGKRFITAVVSINGFPTETLTVAHFHAGAPRGPAVSRATYRVRGHTLKASWRRARHVKDYEVDVTLHHGMLSYMFPARAPGAKLALPAGAKVRRLTITATGRSGVVGRHVRARRVGHRHRRK